MSPFAVFYATIGFLTAIMCLRIEKANPHPNGPGLDFNLALVFAIVCWPFFWLMGAAAAVVLYLKRDTPSDD